MWCRLTAAVSVFALVLGSLAAPHTHVHESVRGMSDDHHRPQPTALLHTHATPHSDAHDHDIPPESEDEEAPQIWTVDGFVFQPGAPSYSPLLALVEYPFTPAEVRSFVLGVRIMQPTAHGPPFVGGSSLRGPPIVPAIVS